MVLKIRNKCIGMELLAEKAELKYEIVFLGVINWYQLDLEPSKLRRQLDILKVLQFGLYSTSSYLKSFHKLA